MPRTGSFSTKRWEWRCRGACKQLAFRFHLREADTFKYFVQVQMLHFFRLRCARRRQEVCTGYAAWNLHISPGLMFLIVSSSECGRRAPPPSEVNKSRTMVWIQTTPPPTPAELKAPTGKSRQYSPKNTSGTLVSADSALGPAFAFFVPVLFWLSSP